MGVEEAINLNTLTVPSARLFLLSMAALSVLYLFLVAWTESICEGTMNTQKEKCSGNSKRLVLGQSCMSYEKLKTIAGLE